MLNVPQRQTSLLFKGKCIKNAIVKILDSRIYHFHEFLKSSFWNEYFSAKHLVLSEKIPETSQNDSFIKLKIIQQLLEFDFLMTYRILPLGTIFAEVKLNTFYRR